MYIAHPNKENINLYWRKLGTLLNYCGDTIIMGDFNVHYPHDHLTDVQDLKNLRTMNKFVDRFQPSFELVKSNTRNNHVLDLIF